MRRLLRRRDGRREPGAGEVSWDRPPDEQIDDWLSAGPAGGPPWDRPDETEFAPPIDQQSSHWAFQAAGPSLEPEPAASEDAAAGAPLHWSFLEPPAPLADEEVGDDWDGGSLVSVPRSDDERPVRDPAQIGMFDPEAAFVPVVDLASLESRRPSAWPDRPEDRRAPVAYDPLGAPPRGRDSATGTAPPADFVVRPPAADPTQGLPEALSVPAPPQAGSHDPLEWPPIPAGILPPVAHGLRGEVAGNDERGGRRFAWPPPQPVVSSEAFVVEGPRTQPAPEAQQQLWPLRSEPHPTAGPHLGAAGEGPRTRRPMALLTIAGTALAVIALLLLVLQLVASGMP